MEKGEAGSEKEKEEKQEETPLEEGHLLAKGHISTITTGRIGSQLRTQDHSIEHQDRSGINELGGAVAHSSLRFWFFGRAASILV